ncbi:hypothetical protein DPMN_110375 [Dreissena polymorpha]|uniref:Uncharacterized protein n=1 Tax=Dreissena polymorpha TaxID=45954 RepID=A0A9D4KCV7_DREPO|nr:hypothetical protein DPMN_110375 [Dreissena polymorpha]
MAKWSTGRTPGIEERTSKWEEALSKPPQRPVKRKATDSLFLLAIVITLDSIKAFAESVSGVLQVRLSRNIFTDRRAMDNLIKRRQSLVKDAIEPTGRWSTFPNNAPMIEEFASLLGTRSSYIHTIRRKDNIILRPSAWLMMKMQDLSVHLLQFLITLMKSPTRHFLPHLHPLSTSQLLLDRQHPCKNLPSLLML